MSIDGLAAPQAKAVQPLGDCASEVICRLSTLNQHSGAAACPHGVYPTLDANCWLYLEYFDPGTPRHGRVARRLGAFELWPNIVHQIAPA
jgi:hypothetical protein